jgi:uncharacterized membrane protein
MTQLSMFTPFRFFLPLALLLGGLLVFITPPFQSPDEYNHFFRAFQVSEGHFSPETWNNNRLGGHLPNSLDSFKTTFLPLKGNYTAKTSPQEVLDVLSLRLNAGDARFLDFPNTAIYAPTGYIPQAIGIALARNFTDRCLVLFYVARLFNLLFWTALVWAALQRMPFQRQTMAFLALLPASLAVASSCNADVLTNGLAFYAVAVFCGLVHRVTQTQQVTLSRPLNNPREGVAIGVVALIALNKLVFAPMALLAGLAELDRGTSWKTALRRSFGPLILAFTLAIWWGIKAQNWFIPYDRYDPVVRDMQTLNPGVDPQAQTRFILEHPVVFVETVAVSFARAMPSTAAHFVGKFGWEKNYLPGWLILFLWLGLFALVFTEKNQLSRAQRLWTGGIVLVCVWLWAATMYTLWCPVGARELDNWQGRYFVPVAPLVALAVGVGWGQRWEKWVLPATFFVLVAGNFMLLVAVLQRYY